MRVQAIACSMGLPKKMEPNQVPVLGTRSWCVSCAVASWRALGVRRAGSNAHLNGFVAPPDRKHSLEPELVWELLLFAN